MAFFAMVLSHFFYIAYDQLEEAFKADEKEEESSGKPSFESNFDLICLCSSEKGFVGSKAKGQDRRSSKPNRWGTEKRPRKGMCEMAAFS